MNLPKSAFCVIAINKTLIYLASYLMSMNFVVLQTLLMLLTLFNLFVDYLKCRHLTENTHFTCYDRKMNQQISVRFGYNW